MLKEVEGSAKGHVHVRVELGVPARWSVPSPGSVLCVLLPLGACGMDEGCRRGPSFLLLGVTAVEGFSLSLPSVALDFSPSVHTGVPQHLHFSFSMSSSDDHGASSAESSPGNWFVIHSAHSSVSSCCRHQGVLLWPVRGLPAS